MEVFEIICNRCGKHIKVEKLVPSDPNTTWEVVTNDGELSVDFRAVGEGIDAVLEAKCACGNDVTVDFERIVNRK